MPQTNTITVFKTFLKLGLTSFGGPIAHIAYFRKEFVEKQQWLNENQFSQLLGICQFLPGPASSQLGFAIGLLRAGWLGAIAAFIAFTLPSALLLIAFASALPMLSSPIGIVVIHALKLVAVIVIADAVITMSKKLCPEWAHRLIAVAAIVILLTTQTAWSQIAVIVMGAIAGLVFCRSIASTETTSLPVHYSKNFSLILFAVFFILLAGTELLTQTSALYAIGQTFYQAGALVFGGGHVVLPLLEDTVVSSGWVNHENFLAGYGASQAIPGPMFSFSAYLGAITPTAASVNWLGAFVALFSIFLPGFLLVAAVLPLWQNIANNEQTRRAIAGINAAVVGLLAAALYDPILSAAIFNLADVSICIIGLVMLTVWRTSPLLILAWCIVSHLLLTLL